MAGNVPLVADRAFPFARTIAITGYDLSQPGSDWHAQVRLKPDAPGDPLIDLPAIAAESNADGIKLLDADTSSDPPVSTLLLQITKDTMDGLPDAREQGEALVLAWDISVTQGGGVETRLLAGNFTVQGTVTRNG